MLRQSNRGWNINSQKIVLTFGGSIVLSGNRRNGVNKKTIKDTSYGTFELEIPRDRKGNFKPQVVKKHQTTISEKIIFMYGHGTNYKGISAHFYQVSISTATISAVTD